MLEQHLHAEADAEQGLAAALERFDQSVRRELAHCKSRGADPGQNQPLGTLDRARIGHQLRLRAQPRKGEAD